MPEVRGGFSRLDRRAAFRRLGFSPDGLPWFLSAGAVDSGYGYDRDTAGNITYIGI